ncbi:hypothetical protein HanXRQr2_Chr16g0769701 [Helianthus annuus]|uniref:Uncharacterized protein n=1 Tax=Helianthus annuus TaxID=4232 RepID=A0A9K3DUU5_HELAN|nr:hypothetical protein HanXRQr2_Chr16g0769701 [Helianthus annuus]KAJ0822930.1 hypothetical protein HanPSC8_Chr16g0737781 [Helianthus annuus]
MLGEHRIGSKIVVPHTVITIFTRPFNVLAFHLLSRRTVGLITVELQKLLCNYFNII